MPAATASRRSARLGFAASTFLAATCLAYSAVLAVGVAHHGFREPITDPVLAVMEGITLAAGLAIVVLLAAVHARAEPARKLFGALALVFGSLGAGLTSSVHFVELTAGRQLGSTGIVWPSRLYAAELLAWDGFVGLSLVFAGLAYAAIPPERSVRCALILCGACCLAGLAGPLFGDMKLQIIGIIGYVAVLPVAAIFMAKQFRADVADVAK